MSVWVEVKRLLAQVRSHGIRLTALTLWDKVGRFILGRPLWRFAWVTPDILLGGQPARRFWRTLLRVGVGGVINLRHEYDYADEIGGLEMVFRYLYLPTRDNTAPTLEHLARGVAFIHDMKQEGKKIYIHCWEGLGRGPTMVAAYLVSDGMSPDEAWATIRKARPFIRPVPEQEAQIRAFSGYYHEHIR